MAGRTRRSNSTARLDHLEIAAMPNDATSDDEAVKAGIAALPKIFTDLDEASMLASNAGFPKEQLPNDSAMIIWWHKVLEKAPDVLLHGHRSLLWQAAKLRPYTPPFEPFRESPEGPDQGRASDVPRRPDRPAPMTPREGVDDPTVNWRVEPCIRELLDHYGQATGFVGVARLALDWANHVLRGSWGESSILRHAAAALKRFSSTWLPYDETDYTNIRNYMNQRTTGPLGIKPQGRQTTIAEIAVAMISDMIRLVDITSYTALVARLAPPTNGLPIHIVLSTSTEGSPQDLQLESIIVLADDGQFNNKKPRFAVDHSSLVKGGLWKNLCKALGQEDSSYFAHCTLTVHVGVAHATSGFHRWTGTTGQDLGGKFEGVAVWPHSRPFDGETEARGCHPGALTRTELSINADKRASSCQGALIHLIDDSRWVQDPCHPSDRLATLVRTDPATLHEALGASVFQGDVPLFPADVLARISRLRREHAEARDMHIIWTDSRNFPPRLSSKSCFRNPRSSQE
jgi:hypothetical protein